MSETDMGLTPLPDGWDVKTLGEITDIFKGGTPKRNVEKYFQGNIAWAIPTDITKLNGALYIDDTETHISEEALGKSSARLLPAGTVLLTSRATIGKVAITNIPIATNQGFANFLCKEVIANVFLAYYLRSITDLLISLGGGTTFLEITKKTLLNVEIPLPPLPEQHRIVAKIEELFTKLDVGINELHKAQSQLKRYRQSVLKSAFEGKLTEAWRAGHQDEIGPPTVSEGDLPDGWTRVTVGKIAQKIHYGYTESATDDPIGPKFLRITDIQNNSVNWDSVPYCRIDEIKQQQYLLKENDLVFARTGATVGKSFLIQGDIPDAVFASYLIRIVLEKEINAKFVYTFFQSQSYWMQIHQGKVGSGQPNVNAKILSRITLPLPPLSEQQAIVSEVESRLSVTDEVEKTITAELKRAEQLRQSILKKAFSGELVPQDPNDEPASVLLERIKVQKEIVLQ